MSGFIHERKHIVLTKMSDGRDCRAEVKSRPAMLFTRSDGADNSGFATLLVHCHLIVSRKYILLPYPPLNNVNE
jgi:hypothetical protein